MSRPTTSSDASHFPSAMNFQDLLDISNSTPEECASSLKKTNAHGALPSANSTYPPSTHPKDDTLAAIKYEDSTLQKMGSLLESNALADVTLLVGENKTIIHAHKLVLALASPVFTAMFYGEFSNPKNSTLNNPTPSSTSQPPPSPQIPGTSQQPEKSGPLTRHNILNPLSPPGSVASSHLPPPPPSSWQAAAIVEIPDCTPEAIKFFLQFIYNNGTLPGEGGPSVDDALSLLYTARKYSVRALEDKCIITLSSSITAENVFDILYAATFYNLSSLDYLCWQFMEDNPIDVVNTHMDYLTHDTLQSILKNDRLNCNEVDLFQAMMRWAEIECTKMNLDPSPENIRRLCSTELRLIRFPIMTGPEFADIVVPTGVLTVEQVAKVFTAINTSEDKKKEQAEHLQDTSRSTVLLTGMEFSSLRRTPNVKKQIAPNQQQKGQSQGTNINSAGGGGSGGREEQDSNLMNRPPPVFTFMADQHGGEDLINQQSVNVSLNVNPAPPPPPVPPVMGVGAHPHAPPATPVIPQTSAVRIGRGGGHGHGHGHRNRDRDENNVDGHRNENVVGVIDYGIPGVVGIVPFSVPSSQGTAQGAGERGRTRHRPTRRRRRSGSNGSTESGSVGGGGAGGSGQ